MSAFAPKIARRRRFFAQHLAAYLVVMASLAVLGRDSPAPYLLLVPALAWGVVVLSHFLNLRRDVEALQDAADEAQARPQVALPAEDDRLEDATFARAEALLRRERAR